MKTVLFVGAGRHQRRAILRAKELGLRVVAVDRNPDAPGLQAADVGEAVDFTDVAAVTEVARRHGVDEPSRERRADEAGAARDQDPLALESHAASLDALTVG